MLPTQDGGNIQQRVPETLTFNPHPTTGYTTPYVSDFLLD